MAAPRSRRAIVGSLVAAGAAAMTVSAQAEAPAKKKIHTRGPKPETPPIYSTAVSFGNLLFIAGKSSHGTPPGRSALT